MILLGFYITAIYCALILGFLIGSYRIREIKTFISNEERGFSIIIPFRNEETRLPALLNNLVELEYNRTRFELLLVNDNSSDRSLEIVKNFISPSGISIHVLQAVRTSNSPKKDAITTAIKQAKFDWILTTDADCNVSKNWLNSFNSVISKQGYHLIVAPVCLQGSDSFFNAFQKLDFLSLQGATIGAFGIEQPFLCNGANLCYQKKVFEQLNGFEGNTSIASGDDIFLLQKVIRSNKYKIGYLKSKDAVVRTYPEPTLKSLIEQRKRWAAKASAYQQFFSKLVALMVFSMNAILLLLLILSCVGLFSWQHLLIYFILKLSVDLLLLIKTATFFSQMQVLKWYLASSLIYPFFTMFVAISSLFTDYQWKGRVFKK